RCSISANFLREFPSRTFADFRLTAFTAGYTILPHPSAPQTAFQPTSTTGDQPMKIAFYIVTMFLGVVLAVHLSMNGKVGSVLDNARVGNALFWCIGALGATSIGLTGWRTGALAPLQHVHPVLLTAGIFGASLVFAIAWL